jgi:hypothetical protein
LHITEPLEGNGCTNEEEYQITKKKMFPAVGVSNSLGHSDRFVLTGSKKYFSAAAML